MANSLPGKRLLKGGRSYFGLRFGEADPNGGEGFVGAVLTFGCRKKAAPIWADKKAEKGEWQSFSSPI